MRLLPIVFFTLIISGCATIKQPELTQDDIREVKKIGVLNYTSDIPSHFHIGTTAFQNKKEDLTKSWNLKTPFNNELSQCLNNSPELKVEILDIEQIPLGAADSVIGIKNNEQVLDLENPTYQLLTREYNVDAIIVIRDIDLSLGYSYPSINFTAKGHGVATREAFGVGHTKVFYHTHKQLVFLKTPVITPINEIEHFLRENLEHIEPNAVFQDNNMSVIQERLRSHISFIAKDACKKILTIKGSG